MALKNVFFTILRRGYSSFPGVPKTLSECYDLFYLDDSCNVEQLNAAYNTTVRRYSDSIHNVKEIDKAYLQVFQDIKAKRPQISDDEREARRKSMGGKMSTTYSGHFSRGKGGGSVDAMVEGMVNINIDEEQLKNLPGAGKPLKKNPHENPFIDPVTSKLNEIMRKQNVGTEWMEMKKEMKIQLKEAKIVLTDYRKKLERRSITENEYKQAVDDFHKKIGKVNKIVQNYNLAVPVLRMQMMQYRPERLIELLEADWAGKMTR